jgi:hypothetical protein
MEPVGLQLLKALLPLCELLTTAGRRPRRRAPAPSGRSGLSALLRRRRSLARHWLPTVDCRVHWKRQPRGLSDCSTSIGWAFAPALSRKVRTCAHPHSSRDEYHSADCFVRESRQRHCDERSGAERRSFATLSKPHQSKRTGRHCCWPLPSAPKRPFATKIVFVESQIGAARAASTRTSAGILASTDAIPCSFGQPTAWLRGGPLARLSGLIALDEAQQPKKLE